MARPGLGTICPQIIPFGMDTQASSATAGLIKQMQDKMPTKTARRILMSSVIMMDPHAESNQPRNCRRTCWQTRTATAAALMRRPEFAQVYLDELERALKCASVGRWSASSIRTSRCVSYCGDRTGGPVSA